MHFTTQDGKTPFELSVQGYSSRVVSYFVKEHHVEITKYNEVTYANKLWPDLQKSNYDETPLGECFMKF